MQIQSYKLYASNGRYIRTATKVILNDGSEIKFLDKMSKKDAIKNAPSLLPPQISRAANDSISWQRLK